MLYNVIFTTYDQYEVEAENENQAIGFAKHLFLNERSSPIANTHYDEVEVEEVMDEDEEDL